MKHVVLQFFDARKGSIIDLFWARSDIYVVNFDLFVFIGVIFQKVPSNIKVVVWYGDCRFQRFSMISSHFYECAICFLSFEKYIWNNSYKPIFMFQNLKTHTFEVASNSGILEVCIAKVWKFEIPPRNFLSIV